MTTAVATVDAPAIPARDPFVAAWLWTIAALVFAMIVVGGATRLTDSGLSITEWQPLLGAIPPLNEAHWLEAFEKYRQIPEYHLVNKGMSLEEFKFIYWWEWSHRFLGRFIGLAFALPLAAFWVAGRLRPGLAPKLLGVLALGGLQAVIGWYMVKSGLADRVDVSQYRLALHLTTAFVILGGVVWLALDENPARTAPSREPASSGYRKLSALLVALVLAQVVLGAFVAGLKAGLIYNTWPDMNGALAPSDYWIEPAYLTFFESHAATQFNHRMTAYLLGAAAAIARVWAARAPFDRRIKSSAYALALAVFIQMALGVWTLLAHVPLSLGLIHQGGGAIVLAIAVWHLHAVYQGAGSHNIINRAIDP
jgi:cytochrome c oxidase assembly protein subunit 15